MHRGSMDAKLKSQVDTKEIDVGYADVTTNEVLVKGGTYEDAADMTRLGKRQELRRNFTFLSIAGFVMILQSSWESTLLVASYGLTNGGTAGTIWMTVFVITGVMCMICSMAEMASMAPTAGGQYHWVSEFAPASVQKPLSYIVGWCCCLGWVTGNPAAAQITSTMIQGLVLLKNENANITTLWQTTLLIFAFLIIACAFNIWLARTLPMAEGIFLMLHVFGFFAFLLVLWIMSDHAPASAVFTNFNDLGGWGNKGLSTLVGITTPLWCFLCPDAGAHMAEELKDAGSVLPRAMVWSTATNAFFGLVMIITFCFCIGDIETVLDSPTGYPIIQVLYNSTGSYAATVVMTVLLLMLSLVGTITCVAATSRQMWAFARDRGFPFSSYIEHVKPGWDIPVNAIVTVFGISIALTCLNFGSDVALGAILSVSNAALLFSYICSIGCVRLKRLRGQPLLPRRWSLGKFGGPVNDGALLFLVISFVLSFFPISPNPDPADMNWAILLFGAVIVFATVYYHLSGKRHYVPPMTLVKTDY